jgi:flagellar M-ring protein FliF
LDRIWALIRQLGEFWRSLSTAKRAALVFTTVTVLIAVLAVSWLGGRVNYAYLYTNLDPKDAAAIAEKLAELKVPYEVDASGTALRVPSEQVHQLRLEMAGAGLPQGGAVGNEIFDQAHLGATEFEQQVNLRRALEGELARSIMTIEGVDAARVHLVLPKNRLFAAKSEGASASVIVRLRNRGAFGRDEVAGIVHLVATAVPDLSHDRVTVVDQNGVTLHQPGESGGMGLAGNANEAGRNAEIAIEQRVRSLLERTTGAGAVDVRVKLDLDPASRERTEEKYEPTGTALRSEHQAEELSGTQQATVAGVPGAQTNLPDIEAGEEGFAEGGAGDIVQRSHTRNWEIDRVVEKILTPAGDLRRLSIAVLVDGRYEQRDGQAVYVPRAPEELEALRSVVLGAVGFDEKRGDRLELHAVRFVQPDMGDSVPKAVVPLWQKYLPHAALALGVLFVLSLFVLVRRGKSKALPAGKELAVARTAPSGAELPAVARAEARLVEDAAAPRIDAAQLMRRRNEALQIAGSDPASAAIVLREWLNHGEAEAVARSNG